jgi:dihydroorotate dehydrogenase electron transfer subunit
VASGALGPDRSEILVGGRCAADLAVCEGFRGTGLPLLEAADDGSTAFRGTVVDLLARRLEALPGPARVYAVGPEPMLPPLRRLLSGRGVACQVSLERRMACGLGVCRSCVTSVKGPGGAPEYRDVCARGPVFDLEEVVFDELEAGR